MMLDQIEALLMYGFIAASTPMHLKVIFWVVVGMFDAIAIRRSR